MSHYTKTFLEAGRSPSDASSSSSSSTSSLPGYDDGLVVVGSSFSHPLKTMSSSEITMGSTRDMGIGGGVTGVVLASPPLAALQSMTDMRSASASSRQTASPQGSHSSVDCGSPATSPVQPPSSGSSKASSFLSSSSTPFGINDILSRSQGCENPTLLTPKDTCSPTGSAPQPRSIPASSSQFSFLAAAPSRLTGGMFLNAAAAAAAAAAIRMQSGCNGMTSAVNNRPSVYWTPAGVLPPPSWRSSQGKVKVRPLHWSSLNRQCVN